MTFWRDLKIGTKIVAALAALLLTAAAVGGVAFLQMSKMNAAAFEIRDNWLPSVGKLGELRTTIARLMRAQADLLIEVTSKHEVEAAVSGLDAAIKEAQAAYDGYKPLITPNTEDEELMRQFALLWRDIDEAARKLRALGANGETDAASSYYHDVVEPLRLKVQDVLARDAKFNETQGQRASAVGEAAYNSARLTLLLVLLLGAGVGAAAAGAIIAGGGGRLAGRAWRSRRSRGATPAWRFPTTAGATRSAL
jgi:methyl-accepting chemotaxis protein